MIAVAHLVKTFRSGRGRVTALADVSFSIPGGAAAVIMGISGSGKSTLLHCVGGIEMPDQGTIHVFDRPIHRLPANRLGRFQRRDLGIVFQRGNLLSYLTVAENIGLPLTLNGITGEERKRRIDELLMTIDLGDASRALPHELSGGEIQRVSVARAIAHRPKLLLADEPTASLDTASGERVVRLLYQMSRETGCTLLMATHDRRIAREADRIIELRDGAIVKEETCNPQSASSSSAYR
jgi:ABC-type lipoprotein export system ATPase subunit